MINIEVDPDLLEFAEKVKIRVQYHLRNVIIKCTLPTPDYREKMSFAMDQVDLAPDRTEIFDTHVTLKYGDGKNFDELIFDDGIVEILPAKKKCWRWPSILKL